MQTKIRRPKVNLPSQYKIMAMLSNKNGKPDRTFIKLMCNAIHIYEKRRNEIIRKMEKDTDD